MSAASRPRVALLHYSAPQVVGGVENVLSRQARWLCETGCDVTLLTGRGGAAPELAGVELHSRPELDSQQPELPYLTRQPDPARGWSELAAFQSRLESLLRPLLANQDLLIVHNAFNLHLNLPLVAALHGLLDEGVIRRMVAWCHDVSRYVNPASGERLRHGYPWDLLRTFRPEVAYVAVSPQRQRMLTHILGCAPEQVRVIPNGVDPETLLGLTELGHRLVRAFRLLEADLILLMPVRLTRAKNVEFALRVTAALKAAGLRPKLVVTGPPDPHSADGPALLEELRGLRRKLGVTDEAVLLYEGAAELPGPLALNETDVAELYRVADLVLMPSHREGFGLPILEGALLGKPIFCTRVPVLEQVGARWIHPIRPEESPEYVGARIRAWARRDAAHRFRRRVRQEYTWEAVMTRYLAPLLAE